VQLCAVCYAVERKSGKWIRVHKDCVRHHAAYAAREAARNAEPERWASSASGDWKEGVPKGMVEVTTRARTIVLVPKERYNPEVAGFGA